MTALFVCIIFSTVLMMNGDVQYLTLISTGDWRILNESIWMIGGWVHRMCLRC